jgi:arylsulfatase A-like enzyme
MPSKRQKTPNIVLLGIDSLRADRMSCYGYHRLTTPHMDRFAQESTLFEHHYSAHIPTTSGYTNMLTGMDVFSSQVVALSHKGPLRPEIKTLAEILRECGDYTTTCVGFQWNPASRGFDKYLDYDQGWKTFEQGRMAKAQNLNDVTIPEMDRLAKGKQPFFLFVRHVDPHTPYLPPAPFERMFYHGNESDPKNHSMDKIMDFKPFRDYFGTWMPPGISDVDYVIAQYDGEVAYMDSCIQSIFTTLETQGILDETIVVITSDHGETLDDHDCYFDHHGLYDQTLHVPMIIRYPGKVPAGRRVQGYTQHPDLAPTILELAGVEAAGVNFDGKSLMPLARGEEASRRSEFYITECTWMRKHGWRTPEWKLIVAIEPDFHFKPEVELYNLVEDPEEYNNLAESCPDVVAMLRARMEAWIAKREQETGLQDPIYTQGAWHGGTKGPFSSSQEAYDSMHIGDPEQAQRLQARNKK